MLLFWNKTQFYLDALPDNQELAQYVDWLCWRQDLQKIRRLHRLAPPTTDVSRGEKRVKDYWRIEERGGSPEEAQERQASPPSAAFISSAAHGGALSAAVNLEEGRCCCQFLGPRLRGVGVASAVWMLVRKDAERFSVSSQGCGVWVCVCVREREREGRGGGRETKRPRGAENPDRAGRETESRTGALGEQIKIFWGSPINVNMGSVTGAVLKTLLLLSTPNWNRVLAGNSRKYTANDLKLEGGLSAKL